MMSAIEEGADNEAALTARWLHELGFHVIPCGSPSETPPPWFVQRHESLEDARAAWPKTPRIKWKEYQTRQPTDAEFDRWENSFPGCNWAVLTGTPGGVDVLDGDDAESVGFLNSGAITRAVWVVETAKGEHHWYRTNPAAQMASGVGKAARLDVRGRGGYVIAPGSLHASGHRYRLRIADGFSDDPAELTMLTAADQAAVHLFNQGEERIATNPGIISGSGNLNFDARTVAPRADLEDGIVGKGRNSRINQLTGQLISGKKSLQEILEIVKAQNARNVDERGRPNPLPEGELLTTVASTIRTHLENHPDQPVPIEPGVDVPAEVAKALPMLEAIDAGSLGSIKPEAPEWAWTDWLMKGYVTGIFAGGGVGKSQMVLQLSVCRAAQIPFIDGKVPPPGKTLLLFCEDDIKIVNYRLHRVMQRYNLPWSAIEGKVFILCRVGLNNILMTFGRDNVGVVTPFWHQIRDLIQRTGVDLFVADTRNDVFAGSEIDNSQATQFIRTGLGNLAQEFMLAAVFLAHVSMSGKASGTGTSGGLSWVNAARGQIYMHREDPTSKLVTVARPKANMAESGVEFEVWNDSGFLMPAAQVDLSSMAEEQARADFLAILERQKGQDQFYSFDKRSGGNYAPAEFSRISNQLKKWKTTRVSDFEAAMEQLLDMDVITRWSDQYGKTKHRVWRKEWDGQE